MHAMILAGGLSHERDVSIRSGRRVHDALKGHLERVSLQDVDTELIPSLRFGGVDVVWPGFAMVAALAIIAYVPELVLWLPRQLGYQG